MRIIPIMGEAKPSPRFWQCLLPALLTGLLMWMSFFPLAWGWLGWIALVPFLSLVRSTARPRSIYLAAWLGAFLFFLASLQWMRVADWRMYFSWLLLTWYCSLYFPLALFLLRTLDRRTKLPLVLTLPVVWTALEYVRGLFMGGFPWYYLAHTQHDVLPVIQIADVAGQWGVTFAVAAVNGLVFEGLYHLALVRRWLALDNAPPPASVRSLALQSVFVVVLLGVVVGYGLMRLNEERFEPGPRIALVQGNIPQSVRNDTSEGEKSAGQVMLEQYDLLSILAVYQEPQPDLVVWPETCYPDEWYDLAEGVTLDQVPETVQNEMAYWRKLLRDELPQFKQTNVLLGVNFRVLGTDGQTRRKNSVLLIQPNGQPAGRYDKMHLVPFGEFVPLRDWLPFMSYFAPYDFDYSVHPGEKQTRFPLGPITFGAVICYEDTDFLLSRQMVLPDGDKPPVSFLVNSTNDGWFDGTAEHEEHLAVARFRAVECRRPLVRAANMGISAVIDGSGRVLAPAYRDEVPIGESHKHILEMVPMWQVPFPAERLPLRMWHEYKKTHGVVTAVLPLDDRGSLYASLGDWLPLGCWVVLGGGLVWAYFRRSRLSGPPR